MTDEMEKELQALKEGLKRGDINIDDYNLAVQQITESSVAAEPAPPPIPKPQKPVMPHNDMPVQTLSFMEPPPIPKPQSVTPPPIEKPVAPKPVENNFSPSGSVGYTGYGRIEHKSGNFYEGDIVNDKPHGKGRLTLANGNTYYEGDFVNGLFHGRGKMVIDGKIANEGKFENSEYVGK